MFKIFSKWENLWMWKWNYWDTKQSMHVKAKLACPNYSFFLFYFRFHFHNFETFFRFCRTGAVSVRRDLLATNASTGALAAITELTASTCARASHVRVAITWQGSAFTTVRLAGREKSVTNVSFTFAIGFAGQRAFHFRFRFHLR